MSRAAASASRSSPPALLHFVQARGCTRRSCRATCPPIASSCTRAAWRRSPAARACCTRGRASAAGWWLIATLVGDLPGQRRDGRARRALQADPEAAAVGAAAAAGRMIALGVEDRGALAAAVAVAQAHGLRVTDAVILRDQLNVLVHLRPAPVVARVAGTIAAVRPGTAWQARELASRGISRRAGAPVVAPSAELPPGPHERDGRVRQLLGRTRRRREADPVAAGEALRVLPRGAARLPGLAAGARRRDRGRGAAGHASPPRSRIDARHARTQLLQRFQDLMPMLGELRSPIQPLHGDAHLGNVLGRRPAVERLGGHVPRPGRVGRGLPAGRPRRRRARGGGLRRLPHAPRPGGAGAVGRGALAAGRRVAATWLRRDRHQLAVDVLLDRRGRRPASRPSSAPRIANAGADQ